MAVSIISPKFYGWDADGNPLAFGKLYTYEARSNTPKPTYKSEDQVTENTNPVILNGEGYADVYLDGSYKIVLKDSEDNEIWTADPVSAASPSEWVNCRSASYVSSTSFSVDGDFTQDFQAGRSLRLDSNAVDFAYTTVVSASFSSGITTVTVKDEVITTGLVSSCISVISPNSTLSVSESITELEDYAKSIEDSIPPAITESQNDIVGGKIFKGSNGEYVQNGNTVPAGTTHLRVLVGGVPKIVAMYPTASGLVSLLTEKTATIGVMPVKLVLTRPSSVYVPDDGVVEGGYNLKSNSDHSEIAEDVRMSYIAFGGHKSFPNIIGSFPGSNASYCVIGGAYDNIIDSIAGTIAGGAHHHIKGDEPNSSHNTICGGSYNTHERGEYSFIGGGTQNSINKLKLDASPVIPTGSTIVGGINNNIHAANAVIGGGTNNVNDGDSATVGGGQSCQAQGNFDVVSGGGNNETRKGLGTGQKNVIAGGRYNIIDSPTNPVANVISGGENNKCYGNHNVISGGTNNTAGSELSAGSIVSVCGGQDNLATGLGAVISGGRENNALGIYSIVTGGRGNRASSAYTEAGGIDALASRSSERAYSSGKNNTTGDSQYSEQHVSGSNSALSTTNLTTKSAGEKPKARSGSALITCFVVGRDATGLSYAARIEGLFNGVTLLGSTSVTPIGTGTLTNPSVDLSWSGVGSELNLTCGADEAAEWSAKVEYVEIL